MKSKKILIIDNEEIIVDMMEIFLESEGHKVFSCYGGEEAMELLSKNKSIELILLDIMMPKVSGWEVLEFLNSDEQLSKIPVIIITAKMNEPAEQKFLKSENVKGFMMKPFEMELLKKEIEKVH